MTDIQIWGGEEYRTMTIGRIPGPVETRATKRYGSGCGLIIFLWRSVCRGKYRPGKALSLPDVGRGAKGGFWQVQERQDAIWMYCSFEGGWRGWTGILKWIKNWPMRLSRAESSPAELRACTEHVHWKIMWSREWRDPGAWRANPRALSRSMGRSEMNTLEEAGQIVSLVRGIWAWESVPERWSMLVCCRHVGPAPRFKWPGGF